MQKFSRIALAVSLSVSVSISSISVFALDEANKENPLPVLVPESQHTTASKRITARFTRGHYKKVKISDALSQEVFERYIKQLDYSRNIFLATDISDFQKHSSEFDDAFARGRLTFAYDVYNLNMKRRDERYQYALTLLNSETSTVTENGEESQQSPFDFSKDEAFVYDREDAPWPASTAELDELWRIKVKSDVLNLDGPTRPALAMSTI